MPLYAYRPWQPACTAEAPVKAHIGGVCCSQGTVGGHVGARHDVPPHEEVPVVAHGAPVVGAVVPGGAQADLAEGGVPGVVDLAVDEGEPGREGGAEGHVRPGVAVHGVRRRQEGEQDHAGGVRHGPIEGVEEGRLNEPVVLLVRQFVDARAEPVLAHVNKGLEEIVDDELQAEVAGAQAALPAVVGRGEQSEHPCRTQVGTDQEEALGAHEVPAAARPEGVRAPPRAQEPVVVAHNDALGRCHGHDATEEARGAWPFAVRVHGEDASARGMAAAGIIYRARPAGAGAATPGNRARSRARANKTFFTLALNPFFLLPVCGCKGLAQVGNAMGRTLGCLFYCCRQIQPPREMHEGCHERCKAPWTKFLAAVRTFDSLQRICE